jgi:hypothetical protein
MKHAVVWLSLVAVLAGCAHRPSRWSGLEHETLSVPQPVPGGTWGFTTERRPGATVSRWTRWNESLQVTALHSRERLGPELFRREEDVRAQQGTLLSFRSTVLADTPVNGYPALLWRRDRVLPGESVALELQLYVVGNDAAYSIRRLWDRGPVPESEVQRWIDFLKQVSLCDPRLPDRACPER